MKRGIWKVVIVAASLLAIACGDDGSVANCDAYCGKVSSCGVDTEPGCVDDCVWGATGSSACVSAYSNTNICVAGLSCGQAQAWWDETPPDSYPCKAQDDAEGRACG